MTSPLADRLCFLKRHWFVLPPLLLLLGVAALAVAAWGERARGNRGGGRVDRAAPRADFGAPLPPALAPVNVVFLVEQPREGVDGEGQRQRLGRFLRAAAANSEAGCGGRAGVIVFGDRPTLAVPLCDAARFRWQGADARPAASRVDLGAALALALDTLPEAGPRRIVLIASGVDDGGTAEEQARRARSLGVQIDVLPLTAEARGLDLLDRLRGLSDGLVYRDDEAALRAAAEAGDCFRPVPPLTPPAAPLPRPVTPPLFILHGGPEATSVW